MNLSIKHGKLCGCIAKAAPPKTVVAQYVEARQDKAARKINALLTEHGKRIAELAAKLYAKKMQKDDSTDALVQSILDELGISELSADVVDSLTPEMLRAFKEAGIYGIGQVGIGATGDMKAHLDKAALDYADVHGAELVVGLDATTEDALRGTISRAVEEGWSSDKLSSSIQDSGEFGKARASTIARTELATAHVQGNVQGWRETGMVEKKEWIMGDLHDVEDECDENAADGAIGLDEEFSSGDKFAPAHPNCVCAILPVLQNQGE